jgi:hypothetical protein
LTIVAGFLAGNNPTFAGLALVSRYVLRELALSLSSLESGLDPNEHSFKYTDAGSITENFGFN